MLRVLGNDFRSLGDHTDHLMGGNLWLKMTAVTLRQITEGLQITVVFFGGQFVIANHYIITNKLTAFLTTVAN